MPPSTHRAFEQTAASGADAANGFLGRDAELVACARAIETARGGRLQVILLSGPPGIGKTRLAEEVSARGRASGMSVLAGKWREETGLPEFWVWRQVMRHLWRADAPLKADARSLPALAELSALVPEILDEMPDLRGRVQDPGGEGRLRLFDAIERLLERASGRKPVLLLFDNVHLAGAASLELLAGVCSDLAGCRLAVLLTFRDLPVNIREPFASFLAETRQLSCARELGLSNLRQEETAGVMGHVMGRAPSAGLARQVQRITHGNPLFVREAARLCKSRLAGAGEPDQAVWKDLIPSAVAVTIGRRFSQLSETEQVLLCAASLIGEEFSDRDLALLDGHGAGAATSRAVEKALDHGFLLRGEEAGSYCFSHAVVQQAIKSRLSDRDRAALSRRLAEGLEKEHCADPGQYALRLAGLWAQVSGEDGRRRSRGCLAMAARDALDRQAWEEAAGLFSRLVDPDASETARDEEEADACFGLGRALFLGGVHAEAIPAFRRAFGWYRQNGKLARMVEIATQPGYLLTGEPGHFNFYELILKDLPPDSAAAGMVLHFFGVYLSNCLGDCARAEEVLLRACEIGVRNGDIVLQLRCLTPLAQLAIIRRDAADALQRLDRAESLLPQVSDPYTEFHVPIIRQYYFLITGRAADAAPYLDRCVDLSLRLRNSFYVGASHRDRARLFLRDAQWETARALTDRGLELAPRFVWLLGLRIVLEYYTGNFGAGDGFRRRLLELQKRAPSGPYLLQYKLWSTAVVRARHSGETRECEALVPFLRAAARAADAHPDIAMRVNVLMAYVGALIGDAALAREGYQAVLSTRPLSMLITDTHVERALGSAAHAFADHARAAGHLEEALRLTRFYQDRPLEAWILYELAEAQLPSPAYEAPSDDALRRLRAAHDMARTLKMPPLERKAADLLRRFTEPGSAIGPGHVHVSAREKEVLRLAGEGLTNKEIAVRLCISANTVANHLRHIYEKTGTVNRTEASRLNLGGGQGPGAGPA